MENSLKQRIVGAVVLVALAVIFLPAILKEKTEKAPFESQIPTKPAEMLVDTTQSAIAKTAKSQKKLDELAQKQGSSPEQKQDAIVENTQQRKKPTSKIEADPLINKENKAIQNQSSSKYQAKKEIAQSSDSKPTKSKISDAYKDAAWLIQVASFSSEDNAKRMVKKLKDKKHKAYQREATRKGKTIYRIFVGPYIEKSRAQKALVSVNKVSETKGILVAYDPIKH